jgi:hypothetical protein
MAPKEREQSRDPGVTIRMGEVTPLNNVRFELAKFFFFFVNQTILGGVNSSASKPKKISR